MKNDAGHTQRLTVAALIGYQLNNACGASEIELNQWEACVSWALNDGRLKTRPYIPKRVCVTYEQYATRCETESKVINNGNQSKQQQQQQQQTAR